MTATAGSQTPQVLTRAGASSRRHGDPLRNAQVTGVEAQFLPAEKHDGGRRRPEGVVDELIDEHLGGDGREGGFVAEKTRLHAVEEVDLPALVAPEDEIEEAVRKRRDGAGGGEQAKVSEGDDRAEEGGGGDAVAEAEAGLPGRERVEQDVRAGMEIIGEQQGQREGLQREAGDEIGARRREAAPPGRSRARGIVHAALQRWRRWWKRSRMGPKP